MDLSKEMLYRLTKELMSDTYEKNEKEIKQKISEWYDNQNFYRKLDMKYANAMDRNDDIFKISDYVLDEEVYNHINGGAAFDKCNLQLQKSQLKYEYIDERLPITRNAHYCFKKILKRLGFDEEKNPYCGTKGYYYLEARTNLVINSDLSVYGVKKNDIYIKVSYVDELINIWIENKSSVEKEDIQEKKDISMWDCIRTEKILLALLPSFDKNGELKEYDTYISEIDSIKKNVEKYKGRIDTGEVIKQSFELLIEHLPNVVHESVNSNMIFLNDEMARKAFRCKILDLAVDAIDQVDGYLESFINECSKENNVVHTYQEYEKILSKIIPIKNRRINI